MSHGGNYLVCVIVCHSSAGMSHSGNSLMCVCVSQLCRNVPRRESSDVCQMCVCVSQLCRNVPRREFSGPRQYSWSHDLSASQRVLMLVRNVNMMHTCYSLSPSESLSVSVSYSFIKELI